MVRVSLDSWRDVNCLVSVSTWFLSAVISSGGFVDVWEMDVWEMDSLFVFVCGKGEGWFGAGNACGRYLLRLSVAVGIGGGRERERGRVGVEFSRAQSFNKWYLCFFCVFFMRKKHKVAPYKSKYTHICSSE